LSALIEIVPESSVLFSSKVLMASKEFK
jgi:hypothetical protein